VAYERTGLILNRIRDEAEARTVTVPDELNCVGWVPEDNAVRRSDMQGASLLDLPPGPFLAGVRACLARMGIPARESVARVPAGSGRLH
jgi:CO dehydrogenase nickel-insertion accessory protein CooC1